MIKTGLNIGIFAGWFTYVTASDLIGLTGGIIGISFTILRIHSWFAEKKKRNLEIELLEIKLKKEKDDE